MIQRSQGPLSLPEIDELARNVSEDPLLWDDLRGIISCGPRFCGTPSEKAATSFLASQLQKLAPHLCQRETFSYGAWSYGLSFFETANQPGERHSIQPFINSPSTPHGGIQAGVVDLGRGLLADMDSAGDLAGKAVLVAHEYMFSASRIRPAIKYRWAQERGAAAVLVVNPIEGDLIVSGTVGNDEGARIPAAGVSREQGLLLSALARENRMFTLSLLTSRSTQVADNLHVVLPGTSSRRVVLSAHIDGHDLGQGAMDNAAGIAIILAIARWLGPRISACEAGLQVAFFNAEESDMQGSEAFVHKLSEGERTNIVANINVDAPASGHELTAFTSGFGDLASFVDRARTDWKLPLATYEPPQLNSDHASFARAGIPAMRLATGWEDPSSMHRYMLTPADTIACVDPLFLRRAAYVTTILVASLCSAGSL